jgi:hypothetical protein
MTAGAHRVARSGLLPPVLFATFPVVFLWARNLSDQILWSDVLLVLAWVWIGAGACYAVCRLILRERVRASIAATFLVILTLSFGHVALMAPAHPGTSQLRMLLIAFGALAGAGLVVIARARRPSPRIPSVLSLVGGALVAINVLTIVMSGTPASAGGLPAAGDSVELDFDAPSVDRPDVYYLVFDRYAGERTLSDRYGFDNDGFLSSLEDRNFSVVRDAVANYPGTAHSLASSLNVTYLDDLAAEVGTGVNDWRPLYHSLRGSVALRAFDALGYRTVNIGTWWGPTFRDPSADASYVFRDVREFPEVFLLTTVLPYLADELRLIDVPNPSEEQYARVRFQAESILEVSRDPAPTFTFAHFTLPHTPYVFDAEGDFVPPGRTRPVEEAYLDQLRFTNDLIVELVDALLAVPADQEPILVIQSDEGPHPVEVDAEADPGFDWNTEAAEELQRKMRILNAYHLPGPQAPSVPHTITPVNTFRMILQAYFDVDLPLLPDRAFIYERHDRPFRFRDVTELVRVAQGDREDPIT